LEEDAGKKEEKEKPRECLTSFVGMGIFSFQNAHSGLKYTTERPTTRTTTRITTRITIGNKY